MPDDDRVWFKDSQSGAFIRVVRSPLTFGHSQYECSSGGNEAEDFKRCADGVAIAMHAFRLVLPGALREWKVLADYTCTSGDFLKTLVLRVSAAEDSKKFKVHLVPYFESHAALCLARFSAATRFPMVEDGNPRRGGLIAWLGEREDVVQALEDDFVPSGSFALWSEREFRLGELGKRLREHVALMASRITP